VDHVEEVVRLERPATGGAVGRLGDGRVVFVRLGLPGELVRCALAETAARYARAEAIEVLEASPERVTAPCPHAAPGRCGGCDLQHATDRAQRDWKAHVVAEQLARVAKIERDVRVEAAPSAPTGSRVRLRALAGDDGALGLRRWRSHDLEPIEWCRVADPRLTRAFERRWPAGEVELRAIGPGEPFAVVRGAEGKRRDLRSLDGGPRDRAHSRVEVLGHTFDVSPASFWQAHRDAPELLTRSVLEFAAPQRGESAVDLFGGVGLFAAALAREVGPGGGVTMVESSPEAVADARRNLEGLRARVRRAEVTTTSVAIVEAGDLVVLDPPRSGLARGVAWALAGRAPGRIVYVSCDAATFARDVAILAEGGFRLADLRVFDLFPWTEHVELVGFLDRAPARRESAGEGASQTSP
jgi:tRNA/tmRNA/rRNA uracil-C5-methylase (TrmA/RlmC/RlmD family)